MTPKTAQRLANLILDQWPIPRWISRRLESHRDIAAALTRSRELEQRLRDDSECSPWLETPSKSQPSSQDGRQIKPAFALLVATAASVLLGVGFWHREQPKIPVTPNIVPVAKAVDLRPILASFSAGKKVTRNLSFGIQEVGTQLAQAGNRFGKQLINREKPLQSTPNAAPDDQQLPPQPQERES